MSNKPELEDLFEAARRQKADLERQQRLSDLIDKLAADEAAATRKRLLWRYAGIAASVLLLLTVALRVVYQNETGISQGPLVADAPPVSEVGTDMADTGVLQVPTVSRSIRGEMAERVSVAAASETEVQVRALADTVALEPIADDDVLLAEDADVPSEKAPAPEIEPQPRVFERTSTRLVCGGGCAVRSRQETSVADALQFALLQNSGTSASFEMGSISF